MTDIITQQSVIIFDSVSVMYRVPHERVSGIKEYTIRRLQRRLAYEEFWAVKDVSFSVSKGDVFGIVGRNGAGKSTMLKVMARVLHPTTGRVVMYGKVAPLLELGGGFHQELSGRENVYLNMALLGYARARTNELFDAIVDFAEIKDFIDSPIRTYSTGMVARLGFAVATSIRPDILLVDEVLSVGDTSFQEKCLARMFSFQEQGTTIVIVSHSMATIENFCDRALWLDKGEIQSIGSVSEVIDHYLHMDQDLAIKTRTEDKIQYFAKSDLAAASDPEKEFTLLTATNAIYPADGIFNPINGTFSAWVRFVEGHPGRLCAIFHTDDSRYVLYAAIQNQPLQKKRVRKLVARAGGNKRVLDKRAGSFNFPELAVEFDINQDFPGSKSTTEQWFLVTMTWNEFPEGTLKLYIDGDQVGEMRYDQRFNDDRPLPHQFSLGMRPSTWKGEMVRDEDGAMVESSPHTSMSIAEGGLEIQGVRLYRRTLTPDEIRCLLKVERQQNKQG